MLFLSTHLVRVATSRGAAFQVWVLANDLYVIDRPGELTFLLPPLSFLCPDLLEPELLEVLRALAAPGVLRLLGLRLQLETALVLERDDLGLDEGLENLLLAVDRDRVA